MDFITLSLRKTTGNEHSLVSIPIESNLPVTAVAAEDQLQTFRERIAQLKMSSDKLAESNQAKSIECEELQVQLNDARKRLSKSVSIFSTNHSFLGIRDRDEKSFLLRSKRKYQSGAGGLKFSNTSFDTEGLDDFVDKILTLTTPIGR